METIDARLTTDAEISDRVAAQIGRALRRQLWLLFLDENARQLPTLLPCDDYPSPVPGDFAAGVGEMLRGAIDGTPIESVVLVWERPGGPIASGADRHDAAAIAWACADAGVPVRGQVISHDHGVRWFGPEEYMPAVPGSVEG